MKPFWNRKPKPDPRFEELQRLCIERGRWIDRLCNENAELKAQLMARLPICCCWPVQGINDKCEMHGVTTPEVKP